MEVLIFDKDIVEAVLAKDNEKAGAIAKEKLDALGHEISHGDLEGLRVVWLDEGTEFAVEECSGEEYICMRKDIVWRKA